MAVDFFQMFDFTRASEATYFDVDELLRTAAAGEPRFAYDPAAGESEGLLIEEQRTNLVLWNEDLSDAAWNKVRGSVTSNATTAPDGTQTADLFVPNTDNNSHFVSQSNFSLAANTTYQRSTFVKGGAGIDQATVRVGGGSWSDVGWTGYLDLNTGELTGGDASEVDVTALPGGWFRIASAQTTDGTGANGGLLVAPAQNDSVTFAGDGVSGIYIWRPQLEEGEIASSFIKTEGSQVTRAADKVERTWAEEFSASSGSLFIDFKLLKLTPNGGIISWFAGWSLRTSAAGPQGFRFRLRSPDPGGTLFTVGPEVTLGRFKIAYSYSQGSATISINGSSPETVSASDEVSGGVFELLGRAGAKETGTVKDFKYYPRALTATELQELTAP